MLLRELLALTKVSRKLHGRAGSAHPEQDVCAGAKENIRHLGADERRRRRNQLVGVPEFLQTVPAVRPGDQEGIYYEHRAGRRVTAAA